MSEKDRLSKIEDKLDAITEKLHQTNIILAENTQSLILHEKRTDLAEKRIELMQQKFEEKEDNLLTELELKLNPIRDHVNLVNLVFKYVIPTLAATLLFLVKLGIVKF
jgi:hypothetical protein